MMPSTRLWAAATVTIMIILVVAGWFLGVQPALAAAGEADRQRAAVEAQIVTQQATIASLEVEQKNLPQLEKEYLQLQKSIPGDADASTFINGLDALSVEAGVQIVGFTVAEPQAYAAPPSATNPEPESTDAPAEGDIAAEPVPGAVVTNPLITPDNFVVIGIGVDVSGTYEAVLAFVRGLQTDNRLFLVTGFTSASAGDGTVKAHVDGFIYVLDGTQ